MKFALIAVLSMYIIVQSNARIVVTKSAVVGYPWSYYRYPYRKTHFFNSYLGHGRRSFGAITGSSYNKHSLSAKHLKAHKHVHKAGILSGRRNFYVPALASASYVAQSALSGRAAAASHSAYAASGAGRQIAGSHSAAVHKSHHALKHHSVAVHRRNDEYPEDPEHEYVDNSNSAEDSNQDYGSNEDDSLPENAPCARVEDSASEEASHDVSEEAKYNDKDRFNYLTSLCTTFFEEPSLFNGHIAHHKVRDFMAEITNLLNTYCGDVDANNED